MRKKYKSIAAAALALSLAALPVVQDMPVLQDTSVGIAANAAVCTKHDYTGQTPVYEWGINTYAGEMANCTATVHCNNCGMEANSLTNARISTVGKSIDGKVLTVRYTADFNYEDFKPITGANNIASLDRTPDFTITKTETIDGHKDWLTNYKVKFLIEVADLFDKVDAVATEFMATADSESTIEDFESAIQNVIPEESEILRASVSCGEWDSADHPEIDTDERCFSWYLDVNYDGYYFADHLFYHKVWLGGKAYKINDTIVDISNDNAQKVASAEATISNALTDFTADNDSTVSDIYEDVLNAIMLPAGVEIDVTLNEKTAATDKSAGSFEINVNITCGSVSKNIAKTYIIEKLPEDPTTPDDTNPTTPDDTNPTTPDDTTPTTPDDTNPTTPDDTKPTTPDDTNPTTPDDTKPTTPDDTKPTTPDDTKPTTPDDTKPTPPVITYYTVGFTGDYAGSGITVSSLANTAGSTVTVNVPAGFEVSVISGGSRIAYITDGTGTFTMPSGNVTLNVSNYLGTLTAGYKNAYIYSYDSEMTHIATNSARGGMKSPEGEVTVKLGKKYAGKSVTLYVGRKSTSVKMDEAVLDKNGQATFTVRSGKNYTLTVE